MSILHQIIHMIRPGRTTQASRESDVVQTVQVKHTPFETRDVLSAQLVGFASAIPVGTDVMTVNIGGDNSNGLVIASNHQTHRPKNMLTGETMLYDCAATQQSVYLKADGSVVLTGFHKITLACDTEVDITAPLVKITGNLQVTGSITGGQGGGDQVGVQTHVHSFGGAAPLAGS